MPKDIFPAGAAFPKTSELCPATQPSLLYVSAAVFSPYSFIFSINPINGSSHTVVIAYVLSGQAYLEYADKLYPLYQGDCFIIPSRIKSKIYSDKRYPHSMSRVNVSGKLPDALIGAYFGEIVPIIAVCNIDRFLSEFYALLTRKEYDEDKFALLLHRAFVAVKNAVALSDDVRENFSSLPEDRIGSYIVNRLQEKFSVAQPAQHLDMSVSGTIRLFRSKFGCTPYAYYLSVKIDIAKKMLTETNLTVDDIASRLNFTDRNHFSKTF